LLSTNSYHLDNLTLINIVHNYKTLGEKDRVIAKLMEENRQLKAKIEDYENTSRANKAMLDNVIKKKQHGTIKIKENLLIMNNNIK